LCLTAIESSTDVGGFRGRSPLLKKRDGRPAPSEARAGRFDPVSSTIYRRLCLFEVWLRHRRSARRDADSTARLTSRSRRHVRIVKPLLGTDSEVALEQRVFAAGLRSDRRG